jgi:hypothetical protein
LQRADAVWRLLGRLHVLTANQDASEDPVIVLTSSLPKRGTPADKALRSVGPDVIFDAIELYDPAGLARLAQYAAAKTPESLPGFWTEKELAERS